MAFAAMTALERRATRGRHLARALLAGADRRTGSAISAGSTATACPDLRAEDVQDRLYDSASGFGRLTAVRHSAVMSETPARWERPSVPLGTDPPEWPS